ncbi:sugar phosphate isomerase/epimerase family protein [Cohnella cholangitidis]|uniref:Sugar phosphate isomerase/epimerase n=1 Tax=Cohnella cholangitidis TaxID=2598458 RepID=A0A7G5BUH0_9BACL|nr:sugar phosphate isomerase/epimerase family protein [Cohnella cholangitidis]QMV40604.1 sugar phosphate isomerase/epimerase [Cohnella cholangitidis]
MGVFSLNYYLCSISFRHELVSFDKLVHFAHEIGFSGIELWGAHAKALMRYDPLEVTRSIDRMHSKGLNISMISDYIDLMTESGRSSNVLEQGGLLLSMARLFRTRKIRIFAGNKPSASASASEWQRCIANLRQTAELASEFGMYVVIETHPNTLADTLESTLRLLTNVGHDHVRINLDFLHLWESGCNPIVAYEQLRDWTVNYHLKNISDRNRLDVFEPRNVYSPMGGRAGMVGLSKGAIDYSEIMERLERDETSEPLAIEWFGDQPLTHLRTELAWLTGLNTGRHANGFY